MNAAIDEYINMALRLLGKADVDLALAQMLLQRSEEEKAKLLACVSELEATLAAQQNMPPEVH